MTDQLSISGGCMCGAVRYEARGEPFAVNHCHCHSCRKHNGAVMATLAGYKQEQVHFSGSDRAIYESSPEVGRGFCNGCGTPLTWEGDGGELGQIIEIHMGSFDDTTVLKPSSHAFEPERIAWFDVADDLPRYEGFSELSPLLHHGPLSETGK